MNRYIKNVLDKKGILLAAHRGYCAGNIPCNTLPSYEAALQSGADIVEVDVSVSADGKLFAFHPGMEHAHLKSPKLISELPASEVEALRYCNFDRTPTQYGVSYFEDVLRLLKGRCIVNIDKFWTAMPEITAVVRKLDMAEQVIVKTDATEADFEKLEQIAPDFAYMPMIRKEDTVTDALAKRNINLLGVEVLFASDADPLASEAYIRSMHEKGLLLWANAIVYNYKDVIAADHTDDVSVSGNPDHGWGWLAERGFDMIQTDWLAPADAYLRCKGFRNA